MSYNLEINQGSDYTRTFTVLDSNDVIINLTNYTIAAQLRKNHTSNEYVNFTMAILNAGLGKVSMSLPNSVTSTLSGKYMYDIFLTDPSTHKFKIGDGLITIVPYITR